MKHVSRRVTVSALSAAVVVTMAGVSTWALAGETPAGPVRLVVGLKANAPEAATAAGAVSSMGVRTMDANGPAQKAMSALRAQTVEVSAARKASVIAALKANPDVAYVEVDQVRKAYDVSPDDPMYTDGHQGEVDQVKLPAAWETTKGSSAVKIAVLDTGVTSVGDLSGAVLPGYNYVSNNTNAADDYGHGTMVASLIAGRGNNNAGMAGACWTCAILPVKVLDKTGAGYDSNVAKGIVWATDHGAKIINMSLGGTSTSQVLTDAVAYANLKGVLVVASAGNAGLTTQKNTKQYPAALTDVLAVGATARNSDARADFSSFNKSGDTWVDMAAPGIVTTMDRFGNYHTGEAGTSFSAPMVSGAAGLLKAVHPEYTGWSLSRALLVSARPLANGSWARYGMLDANKLLTIGTELDPPTITGISTPGENWRMKGTFNVVPTGVGDAWSGVRNVDLYVDGVYKSQDRTAPYSLPYNTAGKNGTVKMQIRVWDKAGNKATFDRTIVADNGLPTVKITSGPKDKAKVSGTVKLAVTASDTYGMRRVEMLMNGKVIQTDTTSPYNFSFTASKQPTKMKVQIRAVDLAGNIKYEATRNYTR
ncbi:S8 family serine peptidase [Actinoplanes friuliensis]|uniref:Putative subtilase-family protease n=1 Tax=Actinoplanes friuliensis DSM 7358 TaxID=1246995 RepID=U5VQP2_9ACTN|nr:S8 family serine peptidase [Actinoplanes friuliensis]AGZ39283.1 putative subtilase-family protease [Actinoplanes friuliensis DSM 7358]